MKTKDNEILQLLAAIRAGDDEAFNILREKFAPLVGSMVSEYSEMLEPDDIRQISDIALYNAAIKYDEKKYGGEVTFGLYAKISINNRLLSELRKVKPYVSEFEEDFDVGVASPEEAIIEKHYFSSELDKKGASFTHLEKSVLSYYLDGCSYAEIAEKVGKSTKSVANAMTRIKAKLRS